MKPAATPLALAIALGLSATAAASTNDRGLDPRNFDTSDAACTDFYRHANGKWLEMDRVPAAYASWSAFNELDERNFAIKKSIPDESASAKAAPGSNAQKIGDFYAAALDVATIEKAGAKPLAADLAAIGKLERSRSGASPATRWSTRARSRS